MYATLRINDKCDFACRYCSTHLSNETGCEMSKETADGIHVNQRKYLQQSLLYKLMKREQ